MGEAYLEIAEIIIGCLFVVMIITGILSLANRKKIADKMRDDNEKAYPEYFSKRGILNNDINTSIKKAKFYISKSRWENVQNNDTLQLLSFNRKVELTYFFSFISIFIIYLSCIAVMVQIKYGT
ncbi:hypothetical protein QWY77_08225 [Thalassotalea ponticola]|uniref:hypothetical protein n=1 Tax=Thalassotalea ponticola TaxID=1523392 RepID=UPI0025B3322C|nr:hypothetical protein [Thalassotalea ponticola]MDN3652750.1 hypothetical protein [Thalassotalea ponticola]